MTIRSFIALPIPKDTADELGDVAAKMSYQDKSNAVRWVDQQNYHITLAFLGEQEEQDLEHLIETLDEQITQNEFLATLNHLSPFPESKPKLIAAMVDKNHALLDLQQQTVSALRRVGMLIDKRKFNPHITLGRFRHSRNQYSGAIPALGSIELVAEELVLYESILGASGAHYEALVRFPLEQYSYDELANN